MSVYEAAQKADGPMVVLAGAQYGTGSSRDWAAKGTYLLGVKAVMATSFERIHRSNLVGMGVLPLTFVDGQTHASLGLDGTEHFSIPITDDVQPLQRLTVSATHAERGETSFEVDVRPDTPVEVEYYRNGGILHTVLRQMAKDARRWLKAHPFKRRLWPTSGNCPVPFPPRRGRRRRCHRGRSGVGLKPRRKHGAQRRLDDAHRTGIPPTEPERLGR